MTSRQLVQMVEDKLTAHGVGKVIPTDDVLSKTYKAFMVAEKVQKIVKKRGRKSGRRDGRNSR
jgi:hypothetical protein